VSWELGLPLAGINPRQSYIAIAQPTSRGQVVFATPRATNDDDIPVTQTKEGRIGNLKHPIIILDTDTDRQTITGQTFNGAEVDGLRFTIPANIAPRYGALPSGLSAGDASSAVTARTMNISVQVSMSSSIKSVQVCPPDLPSFLYTYHYFPVTIPSSLRVSWWALHGHPRQRLQPTACARHTRPDHHRAPQGFRPPHLSSPAALLEVHPTIPNSKALMVTLVPKFDLPKSAKPEAVFIVDRSGSMSSRLVPLKSSLLTSISISAPSAHTIISSGTNPAHIPTSPSPKPRGTAMV